MFNLHKKMFSSEKCLRKSVLSLHQGLFGWLLRSAGAAARIHFFEVMYMDYLLSAVPIMLFGAGIFYIVRLRGFYLLHPIRCLRVLKRRPTAGGISPFRALTVALAGTLGVGNIVGVASALCLGGAGAVFWMLVSALVAMVLKYAEITLAMRHRRPDAAGHLVGGAPYYMEDGLRRMGAPRLGRGMAVLFALLCLVNAITMGSILQVNAVSGALEAGFSIPPLVTGVVLAILCVVVVRGGAKRISALTEGLVPLMTVGFLVACLAVIFLRRERLGDALGAIWQGAWQSRSAGAGIFGFALSSGVRYGVMRGLVSNEAGCGTAPMAHAAADTNTPAEQGVFGLLEVFVDTILLCTVTALAILVSDTGPNAFGEDAVRTAQAAFSSVLGDFAGGFFAIAILLFGAATIICWSHYGMTCVGYLVQGRGKKAADLLYLVIFAVSLVWGALAAPRLAWTLADGAIAVMTLLNLAMLLCMHKEVEAETNRLFPPHHSREKSIK